MCAAVLGGLVVCGAWGQQGAGSPKTEEILLPGAVYDVATFRPSDPNTHGWSGGGTKPNGTLSFQNYGLKGFICSAYDVPYYRYEGGPAWLQSDRYDIEAKPDNAAADQLLNLPLKQREPVQQRMEQALLADRLKLKVHFESREMTILALVIAKGGLKIHEAKPGDTYANGLKGPDGKPIGRAGAGTLGNGITIGQGVPIGNVAGNLHSVTGYPIEDRTGLTGLYDFTLHYSPVEPPPPDSTEPSIYTALEQQLGLKLEKVKEHVPVLIIDSVERPSEN
jgi:uncharacterized protein (TIGR03435 family)